MSDLGSGRLAAGALVDTATEEAVNAVISAINAIVADGDNSSADAIVACTCILGQAIAQFGGLESEARAGVIGLIDSAARLAKMAKAGAEPTGT